MWRRNVVFRFDRSGVPSHRMRPAVGSSIRLTIRSVVVLPQPDGPTTTVILPEGTVNVRSETAVVPSRKVLLTASNSITSNLAHHTLRVDFDPSRRFRHSADVARRVSGGVDPGFDVK